MLVDIMYYSCSVYVLQKLLQNYAFTENPAFTPIIYKDIMVDIRELIWEGGAPQTMMLS